jgi:hypothetical protein
MRFIVIATTDTFATALSRMLSTTFIDECQYERYD